MFKCNQNAMVCYVFLNDIDTDQGDVVRQLRRSTWFTRGWKLQELLAPETIVFFDKSWVEIGTKTSLHDLLLEITGVTNIWSWESACIAQKMSWASKRENTRAEDMAYCLMGVFDVNMPLLYGEGGAKVFIRLQLEIIKSSDAESFLA